MDGERRELKNAGCLPKTASSRRSGPTAELPATADMVLDLTGQIVLAGLRQHPPSPRPDADPQSPRGAEQQPLSLAQGALPRLGAHDAGGHARSTLVGLAELALSGCTTVFDHAYVFQERLQGRRSDRRRSRDRRPLSRLPRLDVAWRIEGRPAAGRLRGGRSSDPRGLRQRVIETYHDACRAR